MIVPAVQTPGAGHGPAPLVSIVTPTFNRLAVLRDLVRHTVRLIWDKPVELILVDDGSEDGTWQWLIEEFGSANEKVKCFRSPDNRGPGPARNLALSHASGDYLLQLDSDCRLTDDGISAVLEAIHAYGSRYAILLFPCLEQPGNGRMDRLAGHQEITREDMLYGRHGIRELVPLVAIAALQKKGFRYPNLRVGGESLLWLKILREEKAWFCDRAILLYGTELSGRICTAGFQVRHAGEMADLADAILAEFSHDLAPDGKTSRRRRLIAAGTYHCLAGRFALGRQRLWSALREGEVAALLPLAASLGGSGVFRAAFGVYRKRTLGV